VRRKEKEILDPGDLEAILNRATVCRLGLSMNDQPYVVPMNFAYDSHSLYLHTAPEGLKMEILRKNRLVCFEVDGGHETLPASSACGFSMRYYSVIGFGTIHEVTDPAMKMRALTKIARKMGAGDLPMSPEDVDKVAVLRVVVERVTGKRSG